MKYLASSPTSVTITHLLVMFFGVTGLFFVEFSLTNILISFVFYFLYSGVGISMMLHRYYTHRSFEFKNDILKWICTFISIIAGRGSILGWVYIHRLHHAYSDVDKDPHSPKNKGWRVMFPSLIDYPEQINKKLVRDLLTREQVEIDKNYNLFIIVWILFVLLFGFDILYFAWILPLFLTNVVWNSFIYAGHKIGYRNHETDDNSRNSILYSILLWGEGLHNNHHYNAAQSDYSENRYEIDIIGKLIKLIKK